MVSFSVPVTVGPLKDSIDGGFKVIDKDAGLLIKHENIQNNTSKKKYNSISNASKLFKKKKKRVISCTP